MFASPTPVYVPNTSFRMSNDTVSQFALAVTGGYRGRFAWPGGGSGSGGGGHQALEGLYVGANYHFLHGFNYEHFEPKARLDTNGQGLLFVNPALGVPVAITRTTAPGGNGSAIDTGVAAIIARWEIGFGVNGIANRINWKDVERTNYVLDSLFNGGDFVDLPTVPIGDERVELPVDYRANGAYAADTWSAVTEFGHGYNGTSFRAGFEQRFKRTQLRGGGRTSRSDGKAPAVSASISPIPSGLTSGCSVRAPTSNGSATWRLPSPCASCGTVNETFRAAPNPGKPAPPRERRMIRADCRTALQGRYGVRRP